MVVGYSGHGSNVPVLRHFLFWFPAAEVSDAGGVNGGQFLSELSGMGLVPHDWQIDPGSDQGYCLRCGEAYAGEKNRMLPCCGAGGGRGPDSVVMGRGTLEPGENRGGHPEPPITVPEEGPLEHLRNARFILQGMKKDGVERTTANLEAADRRILKALVQLEKERLAVKVPG